MECTISLIQPLISHFNTDIDYKLIFFFVSTLQFQDPVITNFFPVLGPKAGGTDIKLEGRHLSTGREIVAFIGDIHCTLDR